jgi:hypothetical protein
MFSLEWYRFKETQPYCKNIINSLLHYKFYNVTFVIKQIFVFILTLQAIKKF